MDHIKKEKLQAMNKYKKNQFLNNLILYSLIVIGCILFCSSPLWLPPIYSFMRIFLFVYIPYMKAYISSPKCLFILCNIIVVVLIGESKLVGGSKSSSPTTDIYDEYLNRSVSLRKVCNTTTLVKKKDKEVKMNAFDENVKQRRYDEVYEKVVVEGEKGGVEEEANEKNLDLDEKLALPTEELNKKFEDFIARVNKQRRLEALLCTSD